MLDANSAKNSASFNFFESLGIIGVKNSPLKLSDLLASGYCGADGALGVDYGANCSGVGFFGFNDFSISGFPLFAFDGFWYSPNSAAFWALGSAEMCQQQHYIDPVCSRIASLSLSPFFSGNVRPALWTSSGSVFYGSIDTTSSTSGAVFNAFVVTSGGADAPGPLPLFGVAAAFGCSRGLRRRLQRSLTSSKG
jgi:hypothetical protein